ncbi:hypothetical protein [Duganella vulcania]|uniref:Uncharacterized protein n=1 Tax=Duganella vulcania TaxID=2692166 RepID=A0A845GIR8_9BURK|nr:hypothetical protein [Duganella vulcania]MYM92559.1 hypothetical protein [Duganella vulcania]
MKIQDVAVLGSVIAFLGLVVGLELSHLQFQRNIAGVMTGQSAVSLSLVEPGLVKGPFGVKRVWFARADDGVFEYRMAIPFIGSLPFNFPGNGRTKTNLMDACNRIGVSGCKLTEN